MWRLIWSLMFMAMVMSAIASSYSKTYNLQFLMNDFSLVTDASGITSIQPRNPMAIFPETTDEPNLPRFA